jgi:hypothetical protein
MNMAAFTADVTERSSLREPFKTEETRARIVHRYCAFKELRATTVVTRELAIIDCNFPRLISHRLLVSSPNALVRLQTRYNDSGEAASGKC